MWVHPRLNLSPILSGENRNMTNWMDQALTWIGRKMNGHGSGGAPNHRAPKLGSKAC
jgi:hypothetical protein